jgi:hypothetical protein
MTMLGYPFPFGPQEFQGKRAEEVAELVAFLASDRAATDAIPLPTAMPTV